MSYVVRHMLQIQDRPAMSKEVAADQIAFENTGEVNDLLHSVDCEQRCRWPYYEWLNDAAAPGFARFWITWKDTPDNCLGMGAEVPKQLPELLRRALLMQNLCEWAVVILQTAALAIVKQNKLNASSV
jgi:hypothetical protein